MGDIAFAQLRQYRGRVLLAVVGVVLAVLSTVVLVSLGYSVIAGGEASVAEIGGDLWATAGATTFSPTAVGSVDHSIVNAHTETRRINERDDVQSARAFAFQNVYTGTDDSDLQTITAVGVTGDGRIFDTVEGRTFSGGDEHYADGRYDGPMSGEVLLDERAADRLGAGVGDTLHVGGTVGIAIDQEFTVVGISNDVAGFTGTPTVVLHLGELQQVSGTTGTDPATAIVIAVDDEEPTVVRDEIQSEYPEWTVRTNDEQFQAVLQRQSVVLAAAVTFIVLALGSGIALVVNVFGLLVTQQRRELAALKAIGIDSKLLVGAVCLQGVGVGAVGALVGLGLVEPIVYGINVAVEQLIGFENVVTTSPWIYGLGFVLAVCIGFGGAAVVSHRIVRTNPLAYLEA